ncbi:MAG: thioredoxin family protein [Planctomycetota bacterium]|nr:thioredoxin family protein [Planctomycetota bacterium]
MSERQFMTFFRRRFALLFLLFVAASAAGEWRTFAKKPASAVVITPHLVATPDGAELSVQLAIPPDSYLYAEKTGVLLSPAIRAETLPAETLDGATLPVKSPTVKEAVYAGDVTLRYRLQAADGGKIPSPLTFGLTYQQCTGEICYLPATQTLSVSYDAPPPFLASAAAATLPDAASPLPNAAVALPDAAATSIVNEWRGLADQFAVAGSVAGYIPRDEFIGWLQGDAPLTKYLDDWREKYGLLAVALLLIPLGALLNLTPCVLPMIPINLAIIGAAGHKGGRHGLALGALYGGGMALVYGILGLVVVVVGARFGALNSVPWFNFLLAAIFAALALAMFDVWELDFSRGQKIRLDPHKKIGVFLLGALTALLAGACVAPVLVWVLVLSADLAARGEYHGLLLPFLLGVGLGLPYPLLGAGIAKLPKPGRWMKRVKQIFGVLILAMAVYYGYLGAQLARRHADINADINAVEKTPALAGWRTDFVAALREARRENKPVLVDFTGMVCKSCDAMKATTLIDAAVTERLRDYVKVETVLDDPRQPLGAALTAYYQIIGVPTYVILQPKRESSGQ